MKSGWPKKIFWTFIILVAGLALVWYFRFAAQFVGEQKAIAQRKELTDGRSKILGLLQQIQNQPPPLYLDNDMELRGVKFQENSWEYVYLHYANQDTQKLFLGK